MTNLNELRYFSLVATKRSFTAAAQYLKLPKSTVSRSVGRLEQRLGVRLIERTTRSLRLTEAGNLYLTYCQRMVEEAELGELAIGAMTAVPKGSVRLAAPIGYVRFVLQPLLPEFLRLYPELNVQINVLSGERGGDEDFDLVVRQGPLEDSNWIAKSLMQVRSGLYANPALLKMRGGLRSPGDLQAYPCIVSDCGQLSKSGEHASWRLRREHEFRAYPVHARVVVADPSTRHQLALKGIGIAMLGQAEVGSDLKARRLLRVLPEWEPEPVDLFALHPSRLTASPRVRALLEFLGQHSTDVYKA